jgi:hypothetical protein
VTGEIILIVILAYTAYLLIRLMRTSPKPEQDHKTNGYYRRMLLGGSIGFLLEVGIALVLKPPFTGMWETSNDVHGLMLIFWVASGGVGAIVLAFASLLSFRRGWKRRS